MKIEKLVETLGKEYDKLKTPTLKDYINNYIHMFKLLLNIDEIVYYSNNYDKIINTMKTTFTSIKVENFVDTLVYMSVRKACKKI